MSIVSALHETVSPARWCVTYRDLARLRRDVERAIAEQLIVPTEKDGFDPDDRCYGPSMYTVCNQYIKPVTARKGNTSWALMLHPDGLECDLFVSHAWQEGVFELIDKVLNSWPRGARHAYCCVLANPQNSDINSLISAPRDSPFAQALRSAKWVLAVPNRCCSIYSRIWCTYEIYMAYKWRKRIFTASSPIVGLWRHVLRVLSVFIITLTSVIGLVTLLHPQTEYHIGILFQIHQQAMTLVPVVSILSVSTEVDVVVHFLNYFNMALMGVSRGILLYGIYFAALEYRAFAVPASAWTVEVVAVCIASERDCLVRAMERCQSRQLLYNYPGHAMDARCSVKKDGENIRSEIKANGEERAVDRVVDVLIRAGMSTEDLQQAEFCGVDITGAARCNYSKLMLCLQYWLHFAIADAFHTQSDFFFRAAVVAIVEGVGFVASLLIFSRDRRRFAAQVGTTFLFPCVAALVILRTISAKHPWGLVVTGVAYFAAPLTLSVSFMGAATLTRVPFFGVAMTHMIFNKCKCHCSRPAPIPALGAGSWGTEMVHGVEMIPL